MNTTSKQLILLIATGLGMFLAGAQPVTGVWRGKVIRGNGLGRQAYKLEVKLVKNGDSLTGTSYYYASASNYFRYSVKGFFGKTDNSVSWWDDQLIESRSPGLKLGNANSQQMLSTADFNCPGGGVMKLDGNTHPKNGGYAYDIHLDKYEQPDFRDEWDPIIENYFSGGADPHLIDSVSRIAFSKPPSPPPVVIPTPAPPPTPAQQTTVYQPPKEEVKTIVQPKKEIREPAKQPAVAVQEPELVTNPWKEKEQPTAAQQVPIVKPVEQPVVTPAPVPAKPVIITPEPVLVKAPATPEEKFAQRKNVLTNVIPVAGDSIEFKFYDNAEVDGDSISIFLNQKLLYTHIRLTDKGYSIKIPVTSLGADNELVMVAENLGSIPPNTAYMEAWSGGKRYATRMESTELSSAMIRLKRE